MSRPYICIIYNWTLHCELKFFVKLLLFWMSKSQTLYRQGSSMINFSVWLLNRATYHKVHLSIPWFLKHEARFQEIIHLFFYLLYRLIYLGFRSNWLNCAIHCNIIYRLHLRLNIPCLQCYISHLRVPPILIIKTKHASILLFKTFYLPLLSVYEKPQEVIIKPNEDLPFRNFVLCSGTEKNWFVTSKPRDVLKKM